MYLEVVTPEKKVFTGEVTGVLVPGIDGSFEMLNNHAAIISSLGKGTLRIQSKEGNKTMQIDGGTVELANNKLVVLVESILEE
jgi:F-type H+-transporting ATPase subunit epsilon